MIDTLELLISFSQVGLHYLISNLHSIFLRTVMKLYSGNRRKYNLLLKIFGKLSGECWKIIFVIFTLKSDYTLFLFHYTSKIMRPRMVIRRLCVIFTSNTCRLLTSWCPNASGRRLS